MKFFNLLAVSMFMLAMVMMSCSKQDIGTNNLYNQLDARQGGSTDTTASGGGGGGGGTSGGGGGGGTTTGGGTVTGAPVTDPNVDLVGLFNCTSYRDCLKFCVNPGRRFSRNQSA